MEVGWERELRAGEVGGQSLDCVGVEDHEVDTASSENFEGGGLVVAWMVEAAVAVMVVMAFHTHRDAC